MPIRSAAPPSTLAVLAVLFPLGQAGGGGGIDLPERLERLESQRLPQRAEAAEALWSELTAAGQVPWTSDGSAVFLYRGDAESVAVAGDFNGWNASRNALSEVDGTDLWWAAIELPRDARVDYKLVLDGADWILDPANPQRQWSGFGPNSELAMPAYEPSTWITPAEDAPAGETSKELTFESQHLGRDVSYRVHAPAAELRGDRPLAVLFVTDGHEYLDPRLGALAVVHDNLLAAGRIRPVLLVFVDPRSEGLNLRMNELAADPRLGRALTDELLPKLAKEHALTERADERGVLGTSLGGVAAALISARHRDTIGLALIQSPALHFSPGAVDAALAGDDAHPARVFLSWGTINDGAARTRDLARLYRECDVDLVTQERNEGHSWGQWSALLDDGLEALYPPLDD